MADLAPSARTDSTRLPRGRTGLAGGIKPSELVQAAAIARRYYQDDRTKKEIADEFGISRFRVSRVLARARTTGLIRIEIGFPAQIDPARSDRLRRAYSLHHAIVIETSGEPEELVRTRLGEVAADLLTELVEEGDILGIGWGRTLTAMAGALTSLASCTIVQLTGAVGTESVSRDSVEIVRRVATVAGGPAFPIYAPLVVDTAELAAAIRRQPQVARALRHFDRLTKAVVAVGSWDPPDSQLREAIADAERERLLALGVIAEVCATLLDDTGRAVAGDFAARAIAITADQLKRVPEIIAVAGGRTKVHAVRAVLAGSFATSIVTDAVLADALLNGQAPESPDSVSPGSPKAVPARSDDGRPGARA